MGTLEDMLVRASREIQRPRAVVVEAVERDGVVELWADGQPMAVIHPEDWRRMLADVEK
jgi:hypothetical protein